MSGAKSLVESFCERIGVRIGGLGPSDIRVHDPRIFDRVVRDQSIGLGEAYMEGWWDCPRLDSLFERIYSQGLQRERLTFSHVLAYFSAVFSNPQSPPRSLRVIREHYDLGVDFYRAMLGPTMVYTCGYWRAGARDLDEAQTMKMDLACRKMGLKPGQTILDIGCGFGSFLIHAAQHYGVCGVGVTLSRSQYDYAVKACEGLPIEIRLQDYREIEGEFDRAISIGMFEAVGPRNFRLFMEKCSSLLKPDGALLLHTVGINRAERVRPHWVDKYIFPGGHLPAMSQIACAADGIFRCEDVENFGSDYDLTLMAWHQRFVEAWDGLKSKTEGGERFRRMWEFYLLSFAGGFRARHFQLWQFVYAKPDARLGDLTKARALG